MAELTPLERAVLYEILSEDSAEHQTLRRQIEFAQVSRRDSTGVGFYTYISFENGILPIENRQEFSMGNVYAEIGEDKISVGFLLYVKNGYLDCLEGYTFEGPWPQSAQEFTVLKSQSWGQNL